MQVGASLAAWLGRWSILASDKRRHLVAAGAGAGLAAAFNAPIAGFLFVLEELMQDLSASTAGVAIVACFVASVVARLLGVHSLDVRVPSLSSTSNFVVLDIPYYLMLALLSGLLGALFNKALITTMRFNLFVCRIPLRWRVALAGLLTGVAVTMLPSEFRDNAFLHEAILSGQATWQLAALAFVADAVLVLLDYGSGAPGGLFGPSISLGASLGYLVGIFAYGTVAGGSPSTYALVGMGAFFSAVCRVPITSIVIVFEMTRNFNIVLPLMICCVISSMVAESVSKGSIYDLLLKLSGLDLEKRPARLDERKHIRAADIMEPVTAVFPGDLSLQAAFDSFSTSSYHAFPVVAAGKAVGVVTQRDLLRAVAANTSLDTPVSELVSPGSEAIAADTDLGQILQRFDSGQLSLLPVVSEGQLVGVITRTDVLHSLAVSLCADS